MGDDNGNGIVFGAGFFVGLIITLMAVRGFLRFIDPPMAVEIEQNKAIEAGVGRWTIDQKTGSKKFVYGVQ